MAGTDRNNERTPLTREHHRLRTLIPRFQAGPKLGTDHVLLVLVASMVVAGSVYVRFYDKQSGAGDSVSLEPQSAIEGKTSLLNGKAKQEEKETADRKDEEDAWERQLSKSRRLYRRGDLLLNPHLADIGIEGISVYRGKRLILRKSLRLEDGDFLFLSFPFTEPRARTVHKFDGGRSDFIPASAIPGDSPFTDLDGDGVPDVILTSSCNGFDLYRIYSLGKTASPLAELKTWRSDADFMDIDNDGKCEILTFDSTFYGWEVCNACSPMPPVILKFTGKQLKLSTALMRTQPPSKQRRKKVLADWYRACQETYDHDRLLEKYGKSTFYLEPTVWGDMLDLIYSGNSRVAFELLDEFWSKGMYAGNFMENERMSKEQFKQIFLRQLEYSPYLNEIKKLNRGDHRFQCLRRRKRQDD